MTERLILRNVRLGSPDAAISHLLVENGAIADLDLTELPPATDPGQVDGNGNVVVPGFIDVHVHGAQGADTMDASPESLLRMARFFARHGVTSFFPTTMTGPHDRVMAALRTVKDLMGKPTGGARILGAHLEGPYINAKMIGAQNPAYVRRASPQETRDLLDLEVIQRITLAPEFPENLELARAASSQGVAVSAGHTQATPDDIRRGIENGVRHATHTFNAMVGLHHRAPGTVGAVLAYDEITCELIADGIHVHPVAMRVLANAKGMDRIILITDAMAGAGMPDGQYDLGGLAVTVANNEAHLTEGGALAGSVLTMEMGAQNFCVACGKSHSAFVSAASSLNAARSHPNTRHKGTLARGADADMLILDSAGTILMTIVGGEIVYSTASNLLTS